MSQQLVYRQLGDTDPARNGGRQGPLRQEVRDHANFMRTVGVCFRCSIMKDKCSEVCPCDKCTRKMRKWTWGCTKKGIRDRWEYILPEILTAHLVGQSLDDLFQSNDLEYRYGNPFTLRVSLVLGKPLLIVVRAVFRMQHSEGSFGATRLQMHSPPLLPYLPNIDAGRERIKIHIREWFNDLSRDRNTDWASVYFCQPSERWQHDVLGIICEYFHANISEKVFSPIRGGLNISFLTHLMIHTLKVPEEDLLDLFSRIDHEGHGQIPVDDAYLTAVNRWVKSVVLSLINEVRTEFLSEIHEMLLLKGHRPLDREVTFCAAFLCLTVFSKNQTAVQQLAIITTGHKNQPLTLGDAEKQIREIEHELADLLIYLCQHKAKECQKKFKQGGYLSQRNFEALAAQFGLFERIRKVTDDAKQLGYYFQGSRSLTHIDQDSFMSTNDSRILTKFYEVMEPYLV